MLLEAQAHGLPVVANDVMYGPSDILQDGVSGILTEDGQVQQLAAGMLKLLSDPELLASYREAAYQNATRYSEDAVFEKWQKLLTYFKQLTESKTAVEA